MKCLEKFKEVNPIQFDVKVFLMSFCRTTAPGWGKVLVFVNMFTLTTYLVTFQSQESVVM